MRFKDEDKRQRIKDALVRLILRDGIDGVSVSKIAREAGVSPATIYVYYTSKEDMLERYTLDFAGELGNKGVEHFLRHMGSDKKLIHAFPVIRPDYPESERVIDEIVTWFRFHEKSTDSMKNFFKTRR